MHETITAILVVYVLLVIFKAWRLTGILDAATAAQQRQHRKMTGNKGGFAYVWLTAIVFITLCVIGSWLWPLLLAKERSKFFSKYSTFGVMRSAMRGVQEVHEVHARR